MHILQDLTRQLNQHWHQWRQLDGSAGRSSHAHRRSPHPQPSCCVRRLSKSTAKSNIHLLGPIQLGAFKSVVQNNRWAGDRHLSSGLLFAVAIVSLSTSIGYRYYNAPRLGVDTVASQTLRAPHNATVQDTKATEAKQEAARKGQVPVLAVDEETTQDTKDTLEQFLNAASRLRVEVGPLPYIDPVVLPLEVQGYLRRVNPETWKEILKELTLNNKGVSSTSDIQTDDISLPESVENSSRSAIAPGLHQRAVVTLQDYQEQASNSEMAVLVGTIELARTRYLQAHSTVVKTGVEAGDLLSRPDLLDLSDEEWQGMGKGLQQATSQMLTQGIPAGLPPTQLWIAARGQLDTQVPESTLNLASDILAAFLKPNLVTDVDQTRLQAERAVRAVEPVWVTVRQGDVIVQAGEPITQSQFVLLDFFNLSERRVDWSGLLGFGFLASGAVGGFLLVEHRLQLGLRRRDYVLILLLTLTTPLMVIAGVPYVSLTAIGLLVGGFYGATLGTTVVGLSTSLLLVGMDIGWGALLPSVVGGALGGGIARRMRSREELALLGVGIGISQGMVELLVSFTLSAATGSVWYIILLAAGLQAVVGLAWCIVAIGLSPYLEHLFDLVTPIRLAELANPNRPLLQRLAAEAPGTCQHTQFVASLAEAAARKLGCNVELVRAGTLYHDVGKMHDPLAFVENQMGGPNKHDSLGDPWKSAAIIKAHVSEGVIMARKCRLPKAVQAFIPEHQGTMLIAYFFHQAQQMAQADPSLVVNETDFRYDGPIPQSRETGIVMLADSCEAALRSLRETTSEEALGMIRKILRSRWQDNQLVDSGLTREDLNEIATIFVQVWQQFHHKRIPYPKAVLAPVHR